MPTKTKKASQGKRYTDAQKKRILAIAKKEGMTGAQARNRFGVSTLSFYRWRGPVRSDAIKRRGPGRPKGSGKVKIDAAAVRREVQAQVRRLLPLIIREEVEAALKG